LDGGFRFVLGPIVTFLEAGINHLYLYKQGLEGIMGDMAQSEFGVNLRVGAGLKLSFIGLSVAGTFVAPSFKQMGGMLRNMADPQMAKQVIRDVAENIVPSVMLVIYL
jgi:hypothetical protein